MRRFLTTALVSGLAVLAMATLRLWNPTPVELLGQRVFDFYQAVEPRPAAAVPVVVVDIDERSLGQYGQWPWPRTLIAELIARLRQGEVAAVALNILFAEPDRASPAVLADSFRGLDVDVRDRLRRLPSNDATLAEAIAGGRVVLGQSTVAQPGVGEAFGRGKKASFAEVGENPRRFLFAFPGLSRNLPPLEQAAAGIGLTALVPEADGVLRRVHMLARIGDEIYPSLALEALRVATGQAVIAVRSDPGGVEALAMPGITIPTDRHGRLWLRYGHPDPARQVSASDVLAGRVGEDRLRGSIALVGLSAAGLADVRATPVLDGMTGVAVQAQVLETILAGEWLVRPAFASALETTLIVVLGLGLALMIPLLGPWWSLAVAGAAVGGTVAGSWFAYSRMALLIDVAYPTLATAVLYTFLTALNLLRERAGRRQVRTLFAHYLAPEMVERLARDPTRVKIGGESREMTVMFTDLRGFTSISEEFVDTPEALTRLLNRYFTAMTDRILEAGGTIDKYMGDGIMAFWNAPLDDPDHARHACAAALELLDGARKLNLKLQADAAASGGRYIPASIGVGLNTGRCIVGNLGSEHRLSYSAIGDPVNLAARIESQSRLYGVPIVIGETTREQAPGFAALELDLIRVKGKETPARIHTLLGDARHVGEAGFARLVEAHTAMLAAYRAQDWSAARRHLDDAAACDGRLAALYALYRDRIDAFERAPPPPDWDGVFVADVK